MTIDPLLIIRQFYPPDTQLYQILTDHSRRVVQKSLEIAEHLSILDPDVEFIKTAAMLHDIGIFKTRAQSIGCIGTNPYIRHGYLGRKLLDELGLPPEYGLVCERHTGAGITKENILSNTLPLPPRDMIPLSLEEKIICIADKYHSKNPKSSDQIMTVEKIIESLGKIDASHAQRFLGWVKEFDLLNIAGAVNHL